MPSTPSPDPAAAPPPRRSRLRRALPWLAAALVLLPLLALLAGWAGLRSASLRRALLDRASGWAARTLHLELTAEDFALCGWSGIELRGVRLGAPGARPLVTAERVRARVDLGTLRRETVVIRSLEITAPRLDLAAPFPDVPKTPGPLGFEIRRLDLHGGEIAGAPVTGEAARWLRSWCVTGIDARGTLIAERWDATIAGARGTVERPGFAPLALGITGRVAWKDGEPLEIHDALVTSDGLRLAASGSVGLGEGQPLALLFDARAEPRLLVAGAPPGGLVRASGDLHLPAAAGHVALTARDVPAEALRSFVEEELFTDLALTGTRADLRADLDLGPGSLDRVKGTAEAFWARGPRRLAQASLRVTPGKAGEPAIRLDVGADLLPASPGRRHFVATVTAERWEDLATQPRGRATAQVRIPDVRAAFAEARALWPRLVPVPPANLPLQGTLAADVGLTGVLTAPRATLGATWELRPGARVRVKAEGEARSLAGSAKVEIENLPLDLLASVAPGVRGTATGQADIAGTAKAYRVRSTADVAGFSLPPQVEGLETAHVIADGTLGEKAFTGRVSVEGSGLAAGSSPLGGGGLEQGGGQEGGAANGHKPSMSGVVPPGGAPLLTSPLSQPPPAQGGGNTAATALASFRLDSEGTLVFAPLSWQGAATLDGTGLDIPGTAQVPSFHLTADGLLPPGGGALSRSGRGAVDARGRVGEGASFRLEAPTILLPTAPAAFTDLTDLRLEGNLDAHEIRLTTISGAFPDARSFSGSGRAILDPLLAEADLDLRLTRPVDAVRAAAITASLRAGVLTLDAPAIDTDAGPATLHAVVPLGALRSVPQLADALSSLPFEPAPGLVSVQLAAPSLDSASLLAALGQPARPERLRAGIAADLTFDPAAPAAGRGTVRVDGLTVETPDGRAAADGPLTLRLGEGKVELLPVRVRVAGAGLDTAGFDLRGSALLAAGWRFDDPPAAVVRDVTFAAGGTIDASLLNPFLEGGAASGILTLSAEASGPLDHLDAAVRASGPGASFFWASPYATRVQDPDLAVRMRDGRWTIERGRVGLNGGTVDLAGGGALGGPVSLEATLAGIRYRFDYGLTALLRGTLSFQVPAEPEGRMRLAGRIVVDRGVLDRDVNLDREVLDLFLKKPATPGTEQTALDAIDLDLQIATVDGVRVRNNVADLRASWRPISITGTAATPVIQGQIDIDPGGLLEAYGQTVRIDRGAFIFKGDPLLDPKIDLATTSSLDDPTIGQLRGQERPLDLLAGRAAEEGEGFATEKLVTTGLAGYLGDRFAARLGQSVGVEHLSLRPVLIFGETDPSARLTVGGDVSQNVSFALSVDLRNAESRTYLLDLHGFRELPGFALQGFTNDAGNEGGSFQQVLELGGSAPKAERRPRLRRLRLDVPAGISKRALRRAIRLQKKEPVPESAAFDVEVDAAEFLRRKGYPDPKVTVDVTPADGGKVDVAVAVEPGPHVRFEFAGDRPPRGERAAITTLYRTDFYEPVARAEMEKAAVRAFRRTGHLEPAVEIEVQTDDPAAAVTGDAPRTVVIRSAAGPRVRLSGLEIAGVDPESAFLAARRFPGPLERAELAAALPDADRRLLDTLRTLGYPHARVAGRERDGSRLAVRVEPGERQRLGAVTVTGVDAEEARRLAALPALLRALRPGAPARQDQAAAGALLLERDLADRGFPDAAVRAALRPSAPGDPTGLVMDLVYEVATGPRVRIAGVGFTGERWSRPAQLERLADLPVGETFAAGDVEAARGRLLDTGVFSRVTAEVDRSSAPGEARVTFSVTESPRFHLGYGLRSVSGGATAAVFDVIDRNLLGRAMTLGLRALWEPDDRSGRLYLQTGGLFGTPFSVESYVQDRHRDAGENLVEDSREAALQVARPFGAALTGRLYARYRATHLFEGEPDPFFPFDLQIDRPYLGAQALWDTRSDRVDPVTGLFASADLSGSGSFLGSDFEYARLYAQLNLYRPAALAGRRFVWAQSVRAGVARAFAGQELLREERFFAGGAFSVRGYGTESLGPEERLGSLVRPLGGEALLIVNEELRFPLPFDLTGLLFADAGQVWDTLGDVDADLSAALGLGLRARTPLGLLRLDAGFPLDPRPGDSRYKLYFGFGHAF